MRVPCVVRWPGRVPARKTSTELATMMDWLPTFAKLAGAKLPERAIDGKDIWPIIASQPGAKSPHEAFFCYHMDQLQAVRSGKWKLYLALDKKLTNLRGDTAPTVARLFDVLDDPGETKDVAERFPEVVKRLTDYAAQGRRELGDLGRPGLRERPPGRVERAKALVDD